uniref:THH1/TOM1/TOM3 domain-containing protein n=1 Tax=Arcella intermedia TaxID=1963864 RepID=A0A6B2LF30_9EUKA
MFLMFMLFKLPSVFTQLRASESLIIPTYYTFNWIVLLTSILISSISTSPLSRNEYWHYVLVYFAPFAIFFWKFSVLVFMNHRRGGVSGRESRKISFLISLVLSSAITLIEVFMDRLFKIPLWYNRQPYEQIVSGFWFSVHGSTVIMVLTFIILGYTKFRILISKAKGFFRFLLFLLVTHLIYSIGQFFLILEFKIGYCFNSAGMILDLGFLSPVLYGCFLYSYFRDVNLPRPLLEMDHRGYLNTDT